MQSPSPSFVFPRLMFLLFLFVLPSAHSFHDDGQSLLAFKKLITTDPNNSIMATWTPASLHFCNWTSVTCSRRHPNRVVALQLDDMDLRGTISPSLANLSFLRTLNLSNNMLHGPIPPQLGRLFRLRWLWMYGNQLEGNIPHQLASCTNLVSLVLSFNHLSGDIPHQLGSLPHLQELYLGVNILTDFGIARLLGASFSDSLTSTLALKGSIGYIAPEYGLGERVSAKGDVYSYGILLLEMFTGKRPTSDIFVGNLNLHKWVNMAFPNKVNEVIDNNLSSELDRGECEKYNVQECLLSLLRVGLICSKDSPNERPTMREVVMVLENLKEDLLGNTVAPRRLRQSISKLIDNTNAPRKDALASNDQSSSTF